MTAPVIAVDGLDFVYPDGTAALERINLHVHRSERIALLGPNGAGKTTLVLHLNGIHMPQRGTVNVSGLPLDSDSVMEIRRRVGIVFQDPDDQLFCPTVGEDVAFGPLNLRLPHKNYIPPAAIRISPSSVPKWRNPARTSSAGKPGRTLGGAWTPFTGLHCATTSTSAPSPTTRPISCCRSTP